MNEIEIKQTIKDIEKITRKMEAKFKQPFKNDLPCSIGEIVRLAKRRVNPIVNQSIPKEIREQMIKDKAHGGTRLTDEEYVDAFIRIIHDFTNGCNPKKQGEKKNAYIVTAQTGAGKTKLTNLIKQGVNKPIEIDSDKYKQYREDKDTIDKIKFGMLTGIDSYDHRDNLAEFAIEYGYDLLYEIAPKEGGNLIGVDLELLNKKGYIRSLNVLAVGDIVSAVGIHKRYEYDLDKNQRDKDSKPAKLTDLNRHDESVRAIRQIVINDKNDETMNIYIRGDNSNGQKPILIDKKQYKELNNEKIYDKLQKQSNKEYIESGIFKSDIKYITNKMEARKAPESQIKQLKTISNRGEKILEKNNKIDYDE